MVALHRGAFVLRYEELLHSAWHHPIELWSRYGSAPRLYHSTIVLSTYLGLYSLNLWLYFERSSRDYIIWPMNYYELKAQ